ncbi:MAG: toll/interleukin-1 receptor domain-containing protein [Verrucomicrobiales bacterium]|nr:toll/interleukin-1 receptor domain-containing protein [Verrucomicrobiales bacterium]
MATFEYDVFISYTRDDNYAVPGQLGWVDRFHEELKAWCIRRFSKIHPVRIWRDTTRLDPNQQFDATIRKALESSYLVMALNSTNYAGSEYCRKELKVFRDYAQASTTGLFIGKNHSRILNVLLRNIPHTKWLAEFAGTNPFPLHNATEPDRLGDPTDPDAPEFKRQLEKVVDVLEKLVGQPVDRAASSSEAESNGATSAAPEAEIFVAEVADSLRVERDRLIVELGRQSLKVIPRIPPPYPAGEHRARVEEALGRCALSVHLFDRYAGRNIHDSEGMTYSQAQVRLALERPVSQIVWLPGKVDLAEVEVESHKALLRSLAVPPRAEKAYRYIEGPREAVLAEIHDLVEARRQQQSPAQTEVLIDTHREDQRFAARLWSFLEDHRVPCLVNQEMATARERVESYESNLRMVRSLVVICGRVASQWVIQRLQRTVRLLSGSDDPNTLRLRRICVFLPPGSTVRPSDLEKHFFFLRLLVLNHTHAEQIDPNVVDPLLQPPPL